MILYEKEPNTFTFTYAIEEHEVLTFIIRNRQLIVSTDDFVERYQLQDDSVSIIFDEQRYIKRVLFFNDDQISRYISLHNLQTMYLSIQDNKQSFHSAFELTMCSIKILRCFQWESIRWFKINKCVIINAYDINSGRVEVLSSHIGNITKMKCHLFIMVDSTVDYTWYLYINLYRLTESKIINSMCPRSNPEQLYIGIGERTFDPNKLIDNIGKTTFNYLLLEHL